MTKLTPLIVLIHFTFLIFNFELSAQLPTNNLQGVSAIMADTNGRVVAPTNFFSVINASNFPSSGGGFANTNLVPPGAMYDDGSADMGVNGPECGRRSLRDQGNQQCRLYLHFWNGGLGERRVLLFLHQHARLSVYHWEPTSMERLTPPSALAAPAYTKRRHRLQHFLPPGKRNQLANYNGGDTSFNQYPGGDPVRGKFHRLSQIRFLGATEFNLDRDGDGEPVAGLRTITHQRQHQPGQHHRRCCYMTFPPAHQSDSNTDFLPVIAIPTPFSSSCGGFFFPIFSTNKVERGITGTFFGTFCPTARRII